MRLLTQIFLASLIFVKIVLGTIFIYRVELDPLFLGANAIASEEVQKDPEGIAEPASHLPAKQDSGETGGEAKNIVEEEEIDLNFLLKKKAELKKEEEAKAKREEQLKTT